jgi:hypothetical protein
LQRLFLLLGAPALQDGDYVADVAAGIVAGEFGGYLGCFLGLLFPVHLDDPQQNV